MGGDDQAVPSVGKKVRLGSKCSCDNFNPDYFCNAKKCRNHHVHRHQAPATAESESEDDEVDLSMMFAPGLVDESDDEFAAPAPKPE